MSEPPPFRGPGQKIVQARSEAAARKPRLPARTPREIRKAAEPPTRESRSPAVHPPQSARRAEGPPAEEKTPARKKSARKPAAPNGLRAEAAALRREFGPESLYEPDPAGAERRQFEPRVSLIWLKNVVGVFLLPVAWVWTLTVFGALQRETVTYRFWATEDFWFFGLGGVCWLVWFTGSIAAWSIPQPMSWYVLGHEATHAVWTWLAMGRVSEFRFGSEGGHILTNKPNFWVTLSPYFYPIYCVAFFLLFGVASLFYDFKAAVPETWLVTPMQGVWFVFGAAWAFHLSFTVWMIRRGQSDLSSHGNFFSLVVIYTMNLVVFTLFLWLAAPGVGLRSMLKDLLHHTEYVCDALWNFGAWIWQLWMHPRTG